jgi:hypothetical protein
VVKRIPKDFILPEFQRNTLVRCVDPRGFAYRLQTWFEVCKVCCPRSSKCEPGAPDAPVPGAPPVITSGQLELF